MKRLLFFVIASIIVSSSCTQNEGEIGHLFGQWSLYDYYSDDIHLSGEQCAGYSLKFQSNVVQYVKNLPYNEIYMITGLWLMRSDSLILNFPDISDIVRMPDYNAEADNNPEVFFPIMPSIKFKINTVSNSVLDLTRTTSDGEELRYYFKKLN